MTGNAAALMFPAEVHGGISYEPLARHRARPGRGRLPVLPSCSLPTLGLAMPAGMPILSARTRAALSSAAGSTALEPWQRTFMRNLAARPAGPANASRTTGADGAWSELPPPTLEETPAVYDPTRQSMLLFGGRVSQSEQLSNDVWELSLSGPPTWTKLATTGTPPSPRSGHVLLLRLEPRAAAALRRRRLDRAQRLLGPRPHGRARRNGDRAFPRGRRRRGAPTARRCTIR